MSFLDLALSTELPQLQKLAKEGTYDGFSVAERQAEAYPDEWAGVKDDPAAPEAFALALVENRQAETLQIEDLSEAFEERAAILEHEGGLDGAEAEQEAAKMTATLARNRGYTWVALYAALGGRWDIPNSLGPVDALPLGLAHYAVHQGEMVRPGRFRSETRAAKNECAGGRRPVGQSINSG
jgi:hypothetical protein